MKYRYISSALITKSQSKFGRIIVLTGARQTGKTTLAKKCFPDYTYLSIEDPVTRMEYSRLTASQWNLLYPNAILDEVQKEPVLIESVKSVYDQFDHTKYILLGSSQLLLLHKVKESLAGRCSIYEIFPLTLPEMISGSWEDEVLPSFFQHFITDRNIPEFPPSLLLVPGHAEKLEKFKYYLQFGGYPAIIDSTLNNEDRWEWLINYVRTYLQRDIRDLAEFRNLEPFVKTQQTTSLLTGQLVNYSQLAKEAGITANTARRFLSYLEISYQTLLLKPWHKNKLKRLSKSFKLHYLDPGIQRAILRKQGTMNGNEYESAIVAEIYKQLKQMMFPGEFYHLRTSDGREVDLLIELEDGYIAIEIKMTGKVNSTDTRHLSGLEEILDKPLLQSFVLSNDMSVTWLPPKILAMPAAMFLS
jgi:predicted AAA+ superfamily ATPase